MSNFRNPLRELSNKSNRSSLKKGGIFSILSGIIPIIAFFFVYGIALIILSDETSPLVGTVGRLNVFLYPIVGTTVGIFLFLVIYLGLKTLTNHKRIFRVTLLFQGFSIPLSVGYFLLINDNPLSAMPLHWPPFGTIIKWSDPLITPLILVWHVFAFIIALGAIITFSYLLLSITKENSLLNFKFPALLYLTQILVYLLQIPLSLEIFPYIQQQIIVFMLMCGLLTSVGLIYLGRNFLKVETTG